MLKKFGMVSVGVTATLLAAAPLASAHDGGQKDSGKEKSHSVKANGGNTQCAAKSGDVKDNKGKGMLAAGSILDGNAGQILSCNSFLNNNFSGNELGVASPLLG